MRCCRDHLAQILVIKRCESYSFDRKTSSGFSCVILIIHFLISGVSNWVFLSLILIISFKLKVIMRKIFFNCLKKVFKKNFESSSVFLLTRIISIIRRVSEPYLKTILETIVLLFCLRVFGHFLPT